MVAGPLGMTVAKWGCGPRKQSSTDVGATSHPQWQKSLLCVACSDALWHKGSSIAKVKSWAWVCVRQDLECCWPGLRPWPLLRGGQVIALTDSIRQPVRTARSSLAICTARAAREREKPCHTGPAPQGTLKSQSPCGGTGLEADTVS